MAYDFFPKNTNELVEGTKNFDPEIQSEIVTLFNYLKKNSKIESPINLDKSNPKKVNVSRSLDGDFTINGIKSKTNLSKIGIKFGNGSSGNRGANNRGNLFEPEFAEAMIAWWAGENVSDQKILNAIEDLDKTYSLSEKYYWMTVDIVGGENTPRPIQYSGNKIYLANPKGTGTDVGKSVTDLTVIMQTKDKRKTDEIYLSLKLGTTTTFFNVGVKKVLTKNEIQNYNITNSNGKTLLKMFGIDHKLFCDVFNGKLEKGVTKNNVVDKNQLKNLLKTGIGEGYHIIHKMSGKIISKKMDSSALARASNISSSKIYYGGKTGTGKRIDIEVESETYKFKLNFRDTQGTDGYPTRLMCDFTYK